MLDAADRLLPERSPRDAPGALPDALLELLARGSPPRMVAKGTIVVAEGEPALSMYLILEGRLRVFVGGGDEREVELNQMGPGEYFGELMLGSRVRTASVQAMTRARLAMISREAFEAALRERPDLAFHVIQHLIERVRSLSRNVQGLVSLDVYGRMVRLFEQMAVPNGPVRRVPQRLTQQAMADRVGASRSMVNRILKELTAGGWIALEPTGIVLLKPLPRRW